MLLAFIAYGDEADAKMALELVPNKYYDAAYRAVHDKFAQYVQRFRSKLAVHVPDIIADLISADSAAEADYVDVFNTMKTYWEQGLNADFVLSRARTYAEHRRWQEFLAFASKLIAGPPDEDRIAKIEAKYRATVLEVSASLDVGVSLKDTDRVNKALEVRPVDRFETGITPLDDEGVCPTRKQIFVVLGLSGAGKSTAQRHLLTYPWMHREEPVNALLFALEQDLEDEVQIFFRSQGLYSAEVDGTKELQQVHFSVDAAGRADPASVVKKKVSLKSSLEARDKLHAKIKSRGEFFIKSMRSRVLTPDMVAATIMSIKSRYGVNIDLCGIDYLAGMKDSPGDESRAYLNTMELRNVGRELNCAMVTGQQINRDGEKALANGQPILSAHIEGDKRVINETDKLIIIQQTVAERRAQLSRIYVAKGRQKDANFWVVVSQNMAAGRFAVSSGLLSMSWEKKFKE